MDGRKTLYFYLSRRQGYWYREYQVLLKALDEISVRGTPFKLTESSLNRRMQRVRIEKNVNPQKW